MYIRKGVCGEVVVLVHQMKRRLLSFQIKGRLEGAHYQGGVWEDVITKG